MADNKDDPVAMWHAMLGEMQKGFGAFATRAMASPEADQVGGVADAQKQLGDMMESYLAGMNLPSRSQMTRFDERLRAIERQLAEIALLLRRAPDAAAAPPKPLRSRRRPTTADVKPKPVA